MSVAIGCQAALKTVKFTDVNYTDLSADPQLISIHDNYR